MSKKRPVQDTPGSPEAQSQYPYLCVLRHNSVLPPYVGPRKITHNRAARLRKLAWEEEG